MVNEKLRAVDYEMLRAVDYEMICLASYSAWRSVVHLVRNVQCGKCGPFALVCFGDWGGHMLTYAGLIYSHMLMYLGKQGQKNALLMCDCLYVCLCTTCECEFPGK